LLCAVSVVCAFCASNCLSSSNILVSCIAFLPYTLILAVVLSHISHPHYMFLCFNSHFIDSQSTF
jgi:hypothetical protein